MAVIIDFEAERLKRMRRDSVWGRAARAARKDKRYRRLARILPFPSMLKKRNSEDQVVSEGRGPDPAA